MSHRSLTLVLLISACHATTVAAHEFWIQPSEYRVAPEKALSLTLQVGDGASRQRSPMPVQRILRFEAIGPAGETIDLRETLNRDRAAIDRAVRLVAPGAYVVALESDNQAHNRLSADRFNAYLRDEGLTPALEYRERTHQLHADGFERYSRRAKAIVLVGAPAAGSQMHVTEPLGLQLEIVPAVSPYAVPRPALLPVRVVYEGRSLPGALVKLTDLEGDVTAVDAQQTDDVGVAIFSMPQRGSWLLSVVWTKRLTDAADADFETTFSSLTFGFAEGRE